MLAKKFAIEEFDSEPYYVSELPEGINYPDNDPYILELKQRHPEAVWDRYVPSEYVMARIQEFYEQLHRQDPETAKAIPEFDMPTGVWEYNSAWEVEWNEDSQRARKGFSKPHGAV